MNRRTTVPILLACAFALLAPPLVSADYTGLEVVDRTDLTICQDQSEPEIPYKLDVSSSTTAASRHPPTRTSWVWCNSVIFVLRSAVRLPKSVVTATSTTIPRSSADHRATGASRQLSIRSRFRRRSLMRRPGGFQERRWGCSSIPTRPSRCSRSS